jgi:hypothetical protein
MQQVSQVGTQTDGQGDEEGASQDVRNLHSDNRCGSLTILDNVLTLGEFADGEVGAG